MTIAVMDRRLLLFGVPAWVLPGAAVDLSFSQGLYFNGGPSSSLSTSRASTGYAQDTAGNLILFGNNIPRITNQGLLVEEARTNLILQSQALDQAAWTKTSVAVTINNTTAPDGTVTADLLTESSTTTSQTFSASTFAVVSGSTYAVTLYIKPSNITWCRFAMGDSTVFTNGAGAYFNLSGAGSVGTQNTFGAGWTINSASIVSVANGFYRINMSITTGATTGAVAFRSATADASTTRVTSGAYWVWGVQDELGAFPTSYIVTTTTSATRAADNISLTGLASSLLASAQGSVVIWSTKGQASRAGTLLDTNGTILLGETSGNALTTAITAGLTTGNTATWTGLVGSGLAWNAAGRTLILNNGTTATDATATTPATTFHLGSTSGSSAFADIYISRLAIFNSAISASSLGPKTIAS